MVLMSDIPSPYLYKMQKHQLNYMLNKLKQASDKEMRSWIKTITLNYTDIYTGRLTESEICIQINNQLIDENIHTKIDYKEFLTPKNYKIVSLNDRSEWILRMGETEDRYIHIHPSRTGQFTLRFKGSTLITTLLTAHNMGSITKLPSITQVNLARIQFGLSPVKRLDKTKGILKCWLALLH